MASVTLTSPAASGAGVLQSDRRFSGQSKRSSGQPSAFTFAAAHTLIPAAPQTLPPVRAPRSFVSFPPTPVHAAPAASGAVSIAINDPLATQAPLPNTVSEETHRRGDSLAHLSHRRRESALTAESASKGNTEGKGLGALKVSSALGVVSYAVTVTTPSHNPPPAYGSSGQSDQSQASDQQQSLQAPSPVSPQPQSASRSSDHDQASPDTLLSPKPLNQKRASGDSKGGSPRLSPSPTSPDKRNPPVVVWSSARASGGISPGAPSRRLTGGSAHPTPFQDTRRGTNSTLVIPGTPRRPSVSGGAAQQEIHFEEEPCFKAILACQKATCCSTTNCCCKVVQKIVSFPFRVIHALARNVGCRLFGSSIACTAGTILCCLPGFIATCLTNCCRKRHQEKSLPTHCCVVDCAMRECYEPTAGCCGDCEIPKHACEDGAVCITTGMECCTYGSIGCCMAVETIVCGTCEYTGECVTDENCCYSCAKSVNSCFMRCFKQCMCNSKSLEDTTQKTTKTHITHGRDYCKDFFPVWLVSVLSIGGFHKRYQDFMKSTSGAIQG